MDLPPLVAHRAVGEGPEPALVPGDDDLVPAQHRQRVGSLQPQQRLAQCVAQCGLARPRHEVGNDLGVAGGLEDRSRHLDLVPEHVAVGQVPVVRHGEGALVAFHVEGLGVQ